MVVELSGILPEWRCGRHRSPAQCGWQILRRGCGCLPFCFGKAGSQLHAEPGAQVVLRLVY